jgi:iron complex outermembrane receptor protein
MFRPRLAMTAALVLLSLAPSARAQQAATTTIMCLVRDASGAPVPGASVHAVNETTGAAIDVVTDQAGTSRIDVATPGAYVIETILDGFEKDVHRVSVDKDHPVAVEVTLAIAHLSDAVVVTARRVEEKAQEVPVPISVINGTMVENTGAYNVNRLKDIVPSVQFYSTNPRNSAINIRGLGSPFGLTNDGLDAGVAMYVDGVFYARPATATADFLDVEQVEVLRGPQGTVFGKNTTAGAINITTRKPSFTPSTQVEVNYGNFEFLQAKASVTGPLSKSIAGRVSFSGTTRNGTVTNVKTHEDVNTQNNLGIKGQVLYAPSDDFALTITGDDTRQRPNGYTQLVAGVAPTLRPANRQYPAIAASLGYTPPSFNAFDRVTDVDTPLQSHQDLGGVSATADWKAGPGRFTATTAWRYWNWDPSSDRDFIGLPVTTISGAPSKQRQVTEEIRYAIDANRAVSVVVGAFGFQQTVKSNPAYVQEQGSAAAAFLLAPSAAASTPGLLDGYGFRQYVDYSNTSAAVFGQLQWRVTDRLRILPGLRLNHDDKHASYDQQVYGGLQTTDPVLVALKLSVLAPQSYSADAGATNTSGQVTAAYKVSEAVNTYATYATGFKPVGMNLNGLPTDALGRPVLSTAVVKQEDTRNFEFGVKTTPSRGTTVNVTAYDTEIRDYQVQVTNGDIGVVRGYLANAPKVRVRGAELDASARAGRALNLYGAVAYTDGRYISFPDAPPPLELTGGPSFVDISGSVLPGISRWAGSVGAEYDHPTPLAGHAGDVFVSFDTSARSSFSSSPTYSKYLVADGYGIVNTRVGFRAAAGWTMFVWAHNLFDKNYYELLTAAPGNTGLYVGQPGDPRTIGVTMRLTFNAK